MVRSQSQFGVREVPEMSKEKKTSSMGRSNLLVDLFRKKPLGGVGLIGEGLQRRDGEVA